MRLGAAEPTRLTALQMLACSHVSGPAPTRHRLGSLTALLLDSNTKLPHGLSTLTSLRYLHAALSRTALKQLRRLPQLEWLCLRCSSLAVLPSRMPASLRVLDVRGTPGTFPKHAPWLATLQQLACSVDQVSASAGAVGQPWALNLAALPLPGLCVAVCTPPHEPRCASPSAVLRLVHMYSRLPYAVTALPLRVLPCWCPARLCWLHRLRRLCLSLSGPDLAGRRVHALRSLAALPALEAVYCDAPQESDLWVLLGRTEGAVTVTDAVTLIRDAKPGMKVVKGWYTPFDAFSVFTSKYLEMPDVRGLFNFHAAG